MYRILVRNATAQSFQYYVNTSTDKIFETELLPEALDKFKTLLDVYRKPDLTLVRLIDTEVVIVNADCNDVDFTIDPAAIVVEKNDGTDLKVVLDFATAGITDYTPVAVDNEKAKLVVTALESDGLTDVLVTPQGITAKNPTGTPISSTIIVPEGLFRIYKASDRKDKYVSDSFIVEIKDTTTGN